MDSELSLSNMVLGFFEEIERDEEEKEKINGEETGDDEESPTGDDKQHSDLFWHSQNKLLLEVLNKISMTERKIRADTEDEIRKLKSGKSFCSCSNRILSNDFCRICALIQIVQKLREAGYNSALCKSKWRRSADIPSGEHSYTDVMMESKNCSKNPIRFVIEPNFRAEFEMARANREYKNLVNLLPEIFVGKSEKLKTVVKIMCESAKRCVRENKMHLPPWRKQKYMQSKWMVTSERMVQEASIPISVPVKKVVPVSEGRNKVRRASMLTFDLRFIEVA